MATLTDAWEPANQLEHQLRDALRDGDQDAYFAHVRTAELFVPLAPEEAEAVLANTAAFTWPTATREGRTHVLAYTSAEAGRACLGPSYQHFFRMTLSDMARQWPDQEWWLALNSGLPIEGYLPAWFIGQLTGIAPVPGESSQQDASASPLHAAPVEAVEPAEITVREPEFAQHVPGREAASAENGTHPGGGPVTHAPETRLDGIPPVPPHGFPGEDVPGYEHGPAQVGPAQAGAAHEGAAPPLEPVPPAFPPEAVPPTPLSEAVPPAPLSEAIPPAFPPEAVPSAPLSEPVPPAPLPEAVSPALPPEAIPPTPLSEAIPPAPPPEATPPVPASEGVPPGPESAPPVHAPPVHAPPVPEPARSEPGVPEPALAQGQFPGQGQDVPPPIGAPPPGGRFDVDESPLVLHITPEATFAPLDEEERNLFDAASRGDRKEFLRTLLGVRQIWVPVVEGGDLMLAPGRPGFQWYVDDSSGRPFVPLYTGPGRMRDAMGGHPFVLSDLAKVLRYWPDPSLELVINGGTPIGASVPGDRVTAMATQVDADIAARLATDFPAQSDAERQMFDVRNDPEMIVKVLMDTTVFLPVWSRTPPAIQTRPGDPAFPWSAVPVRGRPSVLAFTSFDWMKAAVGTTGFVMPTFAELVAGWPEHGWSVSVNPGTPIELILSGEQIRALAASAVLRPAQDLPPPPVPEGGPPSPMPVRPEFEAPTAAASLPSARTPDEGRSAAAEPPPGPWAIMQKVVPHDQVAWYLEQAYDRVAGFVHRVQDVVDLNTPKLLLESLGLLREGSPFTADDATVHVIRWPAYRSGLYRIPFGGQSEDALRLWGDAGWVVEPAPFGGDGFAPGSAGSIREYKVDSMRLPHGSEMYAIGGDASERFVARYDADRLTWGDSQ